LFVNGYSIPNETYDKYDKAISSINYEELINIESDMYKAQQYYYSSQGWFWSCDNKCQLKKQYYNNKKNEFIAISKTIKTLESEAKGYLGIFSNHAVSEARSLFWKRFNQGREAATRQSKWDAFFMGISAMGKDETLVEWMLRVFIAMLMNFTFGIFIAVFIFIYSLYDLISSYNPSTITAFVFFILASSAAISFCLSFIIAMYVGATGIVVGAAAISSNNGNARIDNRREHYRIRRED
jgi:ABC-type multidrug transport system fused ATPase/permease subunit